VVMTSRAEPVSGLMVSLGSHPGHRHRDVPRVTVSVTESHVSCGFPKVAHPVPTTTATICHSVTFTITLVDLSFAFPLVR
jgi:hypothetical protein